MPNNDTKNLIIEKGAEIIAAKGYHGSGINEILTITGVPKGSFYFYFKSKEDFGVSVVDHFATNLFNKLDGFLSEVERPPLHRLARYFGFYDAWLEDKGYTEGSLLGNLALEMSDDSELIRKAIDAVYKELSQKIAICLSEGISLGHINGKVDVYEMADFIVSSWEGAILKAKVTRDGRALRLFEHNVFELLL